MKHKINVLVIDAQGGGIGRQLVAAVKEAFAGAFVTAVGTNGAATSAMLKAGADQAATGENSVLVACRSADIIMGPIGITIADAMVGEITPKMATAVGQSGAKRILIPVSHCDNIIAGVPDASIATLVRQAVQVLRSIAEAEE